VLTLWRGDIHLPVPMLFAIGFVFTFINGGLTGLFLGNVPVDIPLSGTMFVVAHFHMVMAVSPILVVFGAIYHWYPKVTGRMLNDALGKFHFWVTFLGAYLIFFPMHYIGLLGVPRRYHDIGEVAFIPSSTHTLNAFITVMALTVGFAQMVFLFNLAWSLFKGRPSGVKPWLEEGGIGDFPGTGAMTWPAAKIGLGVFLAVAGSLFALFVSAYSMRMNMVDWRAMPVPGLLWFNTGVLVLSSIALQSAYVA